MVASSLTKGLLLLAVAFTHQAAAACTKSVTAKAGDTCATLAAQAGITVTQFLRSNPSVSSCSQLVVGGSYCVEGTADSGPTPSSSAPPASSSAPSNLQVSTDGSCGQGITCAGSRFGNCCSAHGFCGSTDDYCGDGCQAGFGSCGAGAGQPSSSSQAPGGTATTTVTVTTITAITRTSLTYQTSTVTSVVTQTRTAGTATVTTTQTLRTTETVETTTTATVPATATTTVRLTSIVTSTSVKTSTTTQTVQSTSLEIDTITSIVTSTRVVTTAACNTTPTKTTKIITTTTKAPEGRPTLPGTPSNCRNYDLIENNDTCRSIATRNDLSLLEFYQLNPSVSATTLTLGGCTPDLIDLVLSGLCQINCDALWEGYYVCVGR